MPRLYPAGSPYNDNPFNIYIPAGNTLGLQDDTEKRGSLHKKSDDLAVDYFLCNCCSLLIDCSESWICPAGAAGRNDYRLPALLFAAQ